MANAQIITPKYLASFFKISIEEATEVAPKLERIEFKNADAIVTYGDEPDGLYFIDDGKANVLNADGETVNEMHEGQSFGEYAILAGEKRMSTVVAHGKVIAYRLSNEDFMSIVGKHPQIVGGLFKQVYSQVSQKHTKLLVLAQKHRGIIHAKEKPKKNDFLKLIITYSIVLVIFLIVGFFAPESSQMTLPWVILPMVFLVAFVLVTKRTLEALILTVLLTAGMSHGGNYFEGFVESLKEGIENANSSETILVMAMIGAFTALLSSAGAISAFRRWADAHIKSKPGSLFSMLLLLFIVFIDESLNVMTSAFCLQKSQDKLRIPREVPALMGSFSTSICSLIPLSVWSFYFSGTVIMNLGDEGETVFLKSLLFNFSSILGVIMAILLAGGLLPKTKAIKEAWKRSKEDKLWPAGSEKYMLGESDNEIYGHPINLILPIALFLAVSIIAGTIGNGGHFKINATVGLLVTLIFMFILYVAQKLLTPGEYMEHVAEGIESALIPILLLVLGDCFAESLLNMNFTKILTDSIPSITGQHAALIPAIMFILLAGLTMIIGDPWAMYGLGVPLAVHFSTAFGLGLPLCIGAVLSAGIVGTNMCPYLEEENIVVSSVGCHPKAYRNIRIPYWTVIFVVSIVAYAVAGFLNFN